MLQSKVSEKRKQEEDPENPPKRTKPDNLTNLCTNQGLLIEEKGKGCEHHCQGGTEEVYCEECNDGYCKNCFEIEHKSKKKSTHEKKPISMKKQICLEHKEVLDLFCLDCNTKLCLKCVYLSSHKDHKILTYDEAEKMKQNEVLNKFNVVENQEKIKTSILTIEKVIQGFEIEIQNLKNIKIQEENHLKDLTNFESSIRSKNIQEITKESIQRTHKYCFFSIEAHTDVITGIIETNDGKIVSVSLDGNIKIIDKNGIILNTINEKEPIYQILALDDGTIVTSCKKKKKIWSSSLKLQNVYEDNNNGKMKKIQSQEFVSWKGSDMVFWKIKKDDVESLERCSVTDDQINQIAHFGDEIMLLLNGEESFFFDQNHHCRFSIEHATGLPQQVIKFKEHFIFGMDDGSIIILNNKKEFVGRMQAHSQEITILLELKNGYIASGSKDGIIKFWDILNGNLMGELKGHTGEITGLIETKNGNLISSSDKKINIWIY